MINPIVIDNKETPSKDDEVKNYTLEQCVNRLSTIGDYIHYEFNDSETAELLDRIGNRIMDLDKLKDEENALGKIVSDEIYSVHDLIAVVYPEEEAAKLIGNTYEDISLEEFQEKFPNIWTYPLTEMDECLRNNEEVAIVRFFDPTKEDGFEYVVADLNETIQM